MILARRVLLLATGEGAARALGVLASIVLARVLGVTGFGDFMSAMSLALVLMVVIDLGQNVHLSRVTSRNEDSGSFILTHILMNKLLLTAATALVTWLFMRIMTAQGDWGLVAVILVVWAGGLSALEALRAMARAQGLFLADSLTNGLESLLRFLGVLGAAYVGFGIIGFSVVFVAEVVIAVLAFGVWLAIRTNTRLVRFDPTSSLSVLATSTPIGIAALGMAGFYRMDQVLVRVLASSADAGLYAAAARISLAANVVGILVVMAVFPDLARACSNRRELRRKMLEALAISTGLGMLAFLCVLAFSGPIVHALYGAEFAQAVPLLRVLSGVIFLNALTVVALAVANALGREHRAIRVVLALSGLNVLANVVCIPVWGTMAPAVISVIGEAAMALALLRLSVDIWGFAPTDSAIPESGQLSDKRGLSPGFAAERGHEPNNHEPMI